MSIATSSKASAEQLIHIGKLVASAGHDPVQRLVANSDLLKMLLEAPDLSGVDRPGFAALLRPVAGDIPTGWFTPVSELVDRIAARPRSEGFSRKQLDTLRRNLSVHEHAGQYQPVTVGLWYGSLNATRDATLLWFEDECRNLGLNFNDYLSGAKIEFYSGSEQKSRSQLTICGLDLLAHYDPKNGIVPNRIRQPGERWPGFVVLQFLNLNPQLIPKLGTPDFPPYGLMMPGLVAGGALVPGVCRGGRYVYVRYDYWADGTWYYTSMPRFRELQH